MATTTKNGRPVALITGASGGIGEALAYRFGKGGYDLVLVARSADRLARVAEAAQEDGAKAHVIALDLQRTGAAEQLEASVAELRLSIHALVNNAGYGYAGEFLDGELEAQLGEIDLNVRSLTELSYRFGRSMKARRRGGILNVASTAAYQPGPYMAVYSATKAYVLSFSEALNQELRGSGVHATALCPGPVLTGFQQRAEFNDSMRLLKAMRPMSAQAVADAGFQGFQHRKAVVIPGVSNALLAKSVPFAPRSLVLAIAAGLQRKSPSL